MYTRIPPRGRELQRVANKPPALIEGKVPLEEPNTLRKGFVVIVLIVMALVVVYAVALMGKNSQMYTLNSSVAISNEPEITELMASNKGSITAEDGNYYDWIEIYNPTSKTINLAGYALSDKPRKPDKFVLPFYQLNPGKFVIVYASKLTSTDTEIHANFKLKSSGETLMMTDPNGHLIQSITYPPMAKDYSYAMDMNDPTKWSLTDKYTPGFPNMDEGYAAYQKTRRATAPIYINEIMAGNTMTIKDQDGDYSDWIEIYNPTDQAVDLTGWGLSKKENDPKKWVFPAMKIEPKQYLIVFASGKNRSVAGKELHTSFRLNSFKDTVILANLRGQIVSEVSYNNLKADTSWGLVPGTDKWQDFTHPTPGYPNSEDGWNALQPKLYNDTTAPVVIEAIMSNNATTLKDQFGNFPDWIELYNRSNKSVDLKGYGLTSKSNKPGLWQFPDVTINSGQYLTVFATGQGISVSTATDTKNLQTNFKISAKGAIVALTAPNGQIIDRCLVPPLRADIAYGRVQGSMCFSYITGIKPGSANANGFPGLSPDPQFSIKAGMYDNAQKVALSTDDLNARIYFTLDGNTPTKSNGTLYTGPIDVQKTTAIRAISYRDGYLPSNDMCSTYLINEGIKLPVLSIVTDPDPMFNPVTGLYVKGPNAKATFPYNGANFFNKTELPAHVELLEPNGTTDLSQDIGLRIFGAYSRGENYKGLAIIARSKYGNNSLDDQIFPDQPYTSYKSFVLKPGGQDVNRTGMRDIVICSLVRDTTSSTLFVQDYRSIVMLVNGEFWGVNAIREKINTHSISQNYNVSQNNLDILEGNGNILKAGTNKEYYALLDYVKTHDLSIQANYDYVASKMDIDSYIDWYTCEICCGNSDMGNIRMWKTEQPNGKWKWIFYDFCWGFNDPNRSDIKLDLNPAGNGVNHAFSTVLINSLLKNSDFKQMFLKRLAYHISVTFEPTRVLARINEIAAQIQPYMDRDFKKWNYGTETTWEKQVEILRSYAKLHPALLKKQMQSYFNLTDAEMQQLFPNQ